MAVGTIVVVSLVSMATVLISADEQKQKQTDKIVEKIQMNEEPVIVPSKNLESFVSNSMHCVGQTVYRSVN